MSISTTTAGRDCVNSLGIPVDNVSLSEAVEKIIRMASAGDRKARLVSTLNVDFLVNALGYAFSRPRHPELLNVLRNSEMVTADGFPIVWLSKIAGKPLCERVTGSDMVPAIAQRAAQTGVSLFLLGGGANSAADAAELLQASNPGLKIAGTAAPYIHTSGAQMTDWEVEDDALLEKINQSGAHILLVGLGNPKQELWFNRNRDRLRVPVSIGVGGTFEFITGNVRRAPKWMQRLNLEWLYRISQDPVRLWQRYAKGLFKLALLTAPLLYHRAHEVLRFGGKTAPGLSAGSWQTVWCSREQSMNVLRLPRRVGNDYLRELVSQLRSADNQAALRWLDFSAVRHIDISAHQEFFALAEYLQNERNNTTLLGLRRGVRRQLAACRVVDLLGEVQSTNSLTALTRAPGQALSAASCRSFLIGNTSLIMLSGRIDASSLDRLGFIECMQHSARERDCIIDLRNVGLLESSAIAQLHPLLSGANGQRGVMISGAGENVRQMFRIAGLEDRGRFINDSNLLQRITISGDSDE